MIKLTCRKNEKLINYLTQVEGLSFSMVNKLLRQKDIRINNVKTNINKDIFIGDELTLFIKEDKLFNIKRIYEDENIIVVNKPKKLEVISETKDISLLNIINPNYFAVHRLDFNTEGLVIFAKNEESKIILDEAFKNGLIDKFYVTICKNKPKNNEELFTDYLIKENNKVRVFKTQVKKSKICKLNMSLIKANKEYSLLKIKLLTGRTHQIRAQLASHNLFVLGDEKYGDFKTNKILNLKNQILKCYKLKFNFSKNNKLFYLNNLNFETDYENILNYFNNL